MSRADHDRVYGMLEGTLVARALGDQARAARISGVQAGFVPGYPTGKAGALASSAEVLEGGAGAMPRRWPRSIGAIEMWAALGDVFHRALAEFGAARCLVALGRVTEAVPRAREAGRVFDGLGAAWLAADASALVPGIAGAAPGYTHGTAGST